MTNQPHNTQELDELEDCYRLIAMYNPTLYRRTRKALLDWHNKQVAEVLDRLAHIAEPNHEEDPYHQYMRVKSAIEAERNKLKESSNA